jgi:uncharacterized membrane protein YqjE
MDERKEQVTGGSIIGELLGQGKRLLKAELELARKDLEEDAKEAGRSTLLLGASAWMAMTGLSALVVSAAMAVPRRPVRGTLLTGVGLLGGSLVVGLLGLKAVPKQPLSRTREVLKAGAEVLKENLT